MFFLTVFCARLNSSPEVYLRIMVVFSSCQNLNMSFVLFNVICFAANRFVNHNFKA